MNKSDSEFGRKMNSWLDICRTMAILLVIISHGRHFMTPSIPWLNAVKCGGFMGVELFFVLSGFLIGTIMLKAVLLNERNSFSWILPFWFRRWMRTYPNYFLFVLINLLIVYLLYGNIPEGVIKYFFFIQALFTPHPGNFFPEAWSLAIEEFFYLLSPLAIALVMKFFKRPRSAIFITASCFFFFSLIGRIVTVANFDMRFGEIRSITFLRLDSIMIGVFLASLLYYYPKYVERIRKVGFMLSLLFFVSIYIATLPENFLDESSFLKVFLFDIAGIGCAGLIVAGLQSSPPDWLIPFSSKIARWSYSAYLVNLPLYVLLSTFLTVKPLLQYQILQFFIFLFLTLFISFVIYRFFESRILAYRDKLVKK